MTVDSSVDLNIHPITTKYDDTTKDQTLNMILLIDGSNNVQIQDWEPLKSWVSDFISDFSEQVSPKYAQTSTVVTDLVIHF